MGHTFPGACVPFGGVQLSPDTDTIPHNIDGQYQKKVYDYCAGYQYHDQTIVGFSHTHFSGTGHSDLGDILLMPTVGTLELNPGTATDPDKGYRSRFSHDTEIAKPGLYQVTLADDSIQVQLTATQRVGVHQYVYPQHANQGHIVLDLTHNIYGYEGKNLWSTLRVVNDTLVTGYRITNGWARTNYTYFAISFSKPIVNYGYVDHQKVLYNGGWGKFDLHHNFPEIAGRSLTAYFDFDLSSEKTVETHVALSGVSASGAIKNLQAEIGDRSFDQIKLAANESWESALERVEIAGSEDQKAMFYTSLYHTLINPSVYGDVDGNYRGLDGEIHQAEGFQNYTVFSLWDTYRAEHPWLNLMYTKENTDMVESMLHHWEQNVVGMLPVWSHMGNENWCMSGYHAVSVLADAINTNEVADAGLCLEATEATSHNKYYEGLADYQWLGYVPSESSGVSASTTLEYAYDDWCIYRMAQKLGNQEMVNEYKQRALNYRHLFDQSSGYAKPVNKYGAFPEVFDSLETHGQGFIEGNSANFSFHVPQDVFGLIDLMGGDKSFIHRLDDLFKMDLPEKYYAKNEDITKECLLGGYVHGNEPSQHIPYLYAWSSQPWKTQYWVRDILNQMYKNNIEGLSGNDDCGQMSAWYIFSSLGFYPVCPGSNEYVLGAPYMPYAKVQFPNGHELEIIAKGVSDKKRYVHKVLLNGETYSKLAIEYKQLVDGGTLEFVMSSSPNKHRGLAMKDKPYSLTHGLDDQLAQWADYHVGKIVFEDLNPETLGSKIYHQLIKDPAGYITTKAKRVLNTLYFSPTDSIVPVKEIRYSLKDYQGVSAKGGDANLTTVVYSTRHIEKAYGDHKDIDKMDYETRGVLFHELAHAYQLEPQGIGNYGNSKVFWAFIEGMADAVRVANGCFSESDRPHGGNYMDGYRYGGFFYNWIANTKDADFLKKFNQSTLHVIPWSFEGGIQYALGSDYHIDGLWAEYIESMTNK